MLFCELLWQKIEQYNVFCINLLKVLNTRTISVWNQLPHIS